MLVDLGLDRLGALALGLRRILVLASLGLPVVVAGDPLGRLLLG